MKYLFILIFSTTLLRSQNNLILKINKAIKEDDLHLVYKNFKDKYIFNVFERDFSGKTNLVFNVVNVKQINDRHLIKTELVEINGNSENKLMKINFYTETIKDFEYIHTITYLGQIDKKTDSILSSNFLLKKIDLPYNENQTEKYDKLDSLGNKIVDLFKKDKAKFLNQYFAPKNCDNSIGDNWAARNQDGKKELNNVEFNVSYFDKKINAATITLTLHFDNNNYSEQDILYFKFINNSFQYFHTSQNFNLIKFLE